MAKKLYYLPVDDLTVYIEVKRVKGLRMRLRDEKVYLSVPPGVGPDECSRFVRDNREWINRNLRRQQEIKANTPELTRELVYQFITRFKPRLSYWQKQMGMPPVTVTFRYMSSRWGSCNHVTRAISINTRLAAYPPECTDYIIVHELAHLVHPNHSPAFWALVSRHIPDWKALRDRLRN